MPTLKTIINTIRKHLQEKDQTREEAHKNMRKATSLSKHSILLTHQKRTEEAEKQLAEAKETITNLWKTSTTDPDIVYGGMFSAALQEYSEANIFLQLTQNSKFPTPKDLNTPPADYTLGLADAIGEFRRLSLDNLREGHLKKAENCLKTMDQIYIELTSMDESYMLVSGLRRKCDIARKIIEATRGDITQEIRRNMLEKQLKHLERKIETKTQQETSNLP